MTAKASEFYSIRTSKEHASYTNIAVPTAGNRKTSTVKILVNFPPLSPGSNSGDCSIRVGFDFV
jgi:hypothetical protein